MNKIEHDLAEIKQLIYAQSILQKEVLNFDDACYYTGRSKQNMYKLTSANKIPHYKPQGKMLYFKRSELDSWMLRNPVKTIENIESEAATRIVLK